jgi:acetyltransferase-like isoleucine patch superfamily enzyme
MKKSKEEWVAPEFDGIGMTQWSWRVLHRDNFKLGNRVEIGSFTTIDARNGVIIEDDVKIGFSCTILSHSSIDNKDGQVILKSKCKIGAGSVIMPGIEIGEGAVVGANSFVNKNVPAYEIWFGSPAKCHSKLIHQ